MTALINEFSVVWFVGSEVKILVKENNKAKVYEGTISDIDSQSKNLSLTLNITGKTVLVPASSLLNCELSDTFFSKAIAISRFASSFAADGSQQWHLHTPDSPGLPPAPAPSEPPEYCSGQYGIGLAILSEEFLPNDFVQPSIIDEMMFRKQLLTVKSITLHVKKS